MNIVVECFENNVNYLQANFVCVYITDCFAFREADMLIMVSAPLSLLKNWIEKQCSTMARFKDCLPLPRPVWLDPYRVSSTDVSSHSTLGLHIPLLSLWVYRMLLTIHNAAFFKEFNWKTNISLSTWPTGNAVEGHHLWDRGSIPTGKQF